MLQGEGEPAGRRGCFLEQHGARWEDGCVLDSLDQNADSKRSPSFGQGALYLISRATGNRKARETGFLGAAAIGHSQLLTLGLKYVTQRKRPLDYKAEGLGGTAFWRGGDSFPSGHSSGSFALATIFAYEYGQDHKWVPYASYGLASVVAASRLSGQKHWMSDLFVGGTMGFLVGRYVYRNHHDPRVDGGRRSVTERLIPRLSRKPAL